MITNQDSYIDKHVKNPSRWQPGQSGNPAGRPKLGNSLAEKVRDALQENAGKEGYTTLDALLDVLKKAALAGDMQAINMLFDRGYGKPGESLKLEGPIPEEEEPVTTEELEELLRLRKEQGE